MTRALVLVALLAESLSAASKPVWPQFRGAGSVGVSGDAAPLPVVFGPRQGVIWKTGLPAGKSSPVLAAGKLFLTAHEGGKLLTLAVDPRTGALLWRREIGKAREERRNRLNDPAAPTAVTDGETLVSFFADFGLVAYDMAGKELWRTPLGPFESEHGMSTSPALGSRSVFVLADVSSGAFLAAFDKNTGEQRWLVPRRNTVGAYASPTVYQPKDGPEQVIASGPYEMAGFDAATGEKLWWVTGLPFQPKSAPLVVDDVVYMNSFGMGHSWPDFAALRQQFDTDADGALSQSEGQKFGYIRFNFARLDENRNGQLEKQEWDPIVRGDNAALAVKLSGKGDQTGNILWRHTRSLPDVPEPLVYRGIVYLVRDGGILTALDAASGKLLKQGRLPGAIDQYFASPVAGDGKIYLAGASGMLTVVRAGADWQSLATVDMEEPLWATPAFDGPDMYLRAGNTLYCFRGERGQVTPPSRPKIDTSAFDRFTGVYRIRPGDEIVFSIEEGMFLMKWFRNEAEVVPTGELTFEARLKPPIRFTFAEQDGKITSVSIEAMGRTQVYPRAP